ncbi:hypothetical protein NliqN6_0087 [Naganishia liquefaciens]|uniref:Major facilitator superfamily (MFS) profile domain-containing protein n=1 Tax=Naganishia liquefaciens TaxID=104408 RepID=A0A8H3TNP2_9TREE|nr:hypothetical protein NliqN6_0087 [Naganishia liquefaciens]
MVAAIPAGTNELVGLESVPIWHKSNRRALFYCSVFVIGAFLYGYDGTYFTGILEMPRFLSDFGDLQPDGTYQLSSKYTSVFASIVQAGEFVGSLCASLLGDYLGRKGALRAAVIIVTIGCILQLIIVGSVSLLIVGRLILGIGVGIISNCVPMYLSEIPPAAIRGSVVSTWQLTLAVGQVIGAVIAQGTKDYESTFSWRFPIAFNVLITLLLFVGSFFVIESPRWLTQKGKDDKAFRALERLHKKNDDLDAETELSILIEARNAEKNNEGNQSKWSDLIKIPADRRRFICAFGILCCQQISGVQFIFSYATRFFVDIGQTNAFLYTIIVDVIEVVGVIVSLFLVNRFGRRPLLISTGIFMTATDVVIGAIGIKRDRTDSENTAIVAMIMLYVFAFNLAWGPLAWAVATELSHGKNKTKIMSIGTAGFWICAWAVTFTLPYLFDADQANLGPMVGWIYAGGGVISVAFVYFCIPESLGRSLEEISIMMDLGVPTRAWKHYKIGSATENFGQDEFRSSAKRAKMNRGMSHHVERADSKDKEENEV